MQDSQFRIELAQREILAGELRGDNLPHVLEVGCTCLIKCLRRLNAAPSPAKQVDFVGHRERQNIAGLRNGRPDREVATGGPVSRNPLALGTGSSRKSRELRGDL